MQNEQIEQEFFEAFGIEPSKHFFCGKHLPRYKCVCWDRARQRNSYCKDWDYKNKKCEFYTEDIERRYYPPITPKIVLGLEEIIITFCATHLPNGEIYQDEMCLIIAKTNENEYYYNILVEFNGDDYEDGYHEPYDFKNARAENRVDSLLSLCTQLKDEIQPQVKALFKC